MRLDLDLPCIHPGVDGAFGSLADDALYLDHELVSEGVRGVVGLSGDLRVEDHLRDAEAVAKVDEDEAAKVTPSVDPSLERDRRLRVVDAKCAAGNAADG